tara:strand:- start:202 stop:663 length:462 start_codon:yes stop_codon:yes gene_type:complete
MASKVKSSTLNVSVKEDITLNGIRHFYESKQAIADINMVSQRIIRVPTSLVTALSFGAAVAAGTYVAGDVKYIRVTNLDDTNYITLGLKDSTNTESAYFKLEKGQTMVFRNTKLETNVNGAVWSTAFEDIETINAQANTASVDIEIFIASSQS